MTRRLLLPAIVPALIVTAAGAQQLQDQTASRFPSPNPTDYTNYVAVGDIDLDDDLDLVFANGGNFASQGPAQVVRVFINDGSASFTDESAVRTKGVAGNYRGVDLGDIDDDGDLDMLLVNDFNQRPTLLINDGTGVYADQTADRLPSPGLSATRGAFADIDNDGDLDIYINNGGPVNRFGCGQNRIFVNDGDGFYADETAERHPPGDVCEPMDVIFGDIDNDFDLDIRTGNRGINNSRLYRNDGSGVFTDISAGVPGDSVCYSYDFGDMNGDGNLDLVGANAGPSNTELLLRGNGTGAFVNVSNQFSPNTSGDDNDSKFLDLDNDGDLDLVIAALFQSREKIYINDGNGSYTLDASRISSVNDASLDVMVADLDSDGRFDIVTGQGESGNYQNRIYMNVTGPVDTIPPTIVRTEQVPDTCDAAGPYAVRATIADGHTSDRGFFDKGVELLVSVDGGETMPVPMKWVGNSMWRGEIPGQAPGSSLQYVVSARDWAGNTGTGEMLVFTVLVLPGDVNRDGAADVDDLVGVILAWGPCPDPPAACDADIDGSGAVDVDDLVEVILSWGGCRP
ncbi:MAG: FG-GAP-like repeat-containing protein [Planctomycetota bacterium]|jgi:hypothetical protein